MSAASTTSTTSASSAASTSSRLQPSRTALKPARHSVHIPAPASRDARSSLLRGGSASSSNAIPKLTRPFSHILVPGRPRYTPNSATSSPLPPGPSLTPNEYGGLKLDISSRTVFRGQVRFRLSRVADGVTTIYPEDVPLERLFDFITPEQLQNYEHEQYAVEEQQEKFRKAAKRRRRPPGSKKRHTGTGPSTQADSGHLSTMPTSSKHTLSSATSETDPLQRDSERSAIKRVPPQSSGESDSSSEASYRSTRSHQSEEVEQGRYQMLPSTPRRNLQPARRSLTTSPAPLKTAVLGRASVSSSDNPNIIDLEDYDEEETLNSESLLRRFHGQSVQSLKQQVPSTESTPKQSYNLESKAITITSSSSPSPVPAASTSKKNEAPSKPPPSPLNSKALTITSSSSSSPVPAASTSKKRENPSKTLLSTTSTTSTTRKRKRRFTRKQPIPKSAEEDDWFVERIIGHRKPDYPSAFNFEYLIKWQDHTHEENTWQSEDSLVDADEMLKNYRARIAVLGAGEHGARWVREVEGYSEGEDDDDDTEMSE